MHFKITEETKESIKAFSISGIIIVTFYVIISHLDIMVNALSAVLTALSPFIFGIFFAFILLPLRNIVERKWLKNSKWSAKAKRRIGVLVAMVVMILILVGFFALLIPETANSIQTFISNLSGYVNNIQDLISGFSKNNQEAAATLSNAVTSASEAIQKYLTGASGGLNQIVTTVAGVVKGVINFLIGIIIAMYILLDTEKFMRQMRMITYALFSKKHADQISYVVHLTGDILYKFIFGKAVDSLIIGILCYICCKLMNMPYSVLIALVVGVTNMIPVFGPFIGAIPCLIILVMINWVKALEFLVFIIVLQQIDGNIIGPYILGDAVGLPTLWVMFAIIIGGALFGVPGMFLGVPVFAVIYILAKDAVHKNLKEKKIETTEEDSD
jgi:predicted PurR-regulated permease PerM